MRRKFLIVAVLIAAIMIGGVGCMSMEKIFTSYNPRGVVDAALAHMEQKYGESFSYRSAHGNSMSGTKSFFVTCESLPEQPVLVQIENYQNENKIYRDNYLAVKYREQTVDFYNKCAEKIFGDVNIYYEVREQAQSAALSADASFEAYLADKGAEMSVMIEVKGSGFSEKKQIEDLIDQIADACGNVSLMVLVVEDDVYGTLNESELEKRIVRRQFICCASAEIENGVQINWVGEG